MNPSPERSNDPADLEARTIVMSRLFDAPRQLVFDAFTDREHVSNWWGPRGFRTTTTEMDLRPGGRWKFVMHGPDGTDYDNLVVYRNVVPGERLEYEHGGDGDNTFDVVVTFDEQGGKTTVTLNLICRTIEQREWMAKFGAVEGGNATLERLSEHLAVAASPEPPFTLQRTFDAPRDLVFRVWTEEEHLVRWFGPKHMPVVSCTSDLRPGGTMHYLMRAANGTEMWGKWVYREVIPPERFSFVASFSDKAGNIARSPFGEWPLEVLSVITFTEKDGRTTISMTGVPINASESERKAFLAGHSSMQMGWGGTLERLEALLAEVQR